MVVLALITLAAITLSWACVRLISGAVAAHSPDGRGVAGPLLAPAPRLAGPLPRHYGPITDPAEQRLIDQFGARFYVLADGSENGSASAVVRPSGLYSEPGHVDPQTGRPSWIMYLGLGAGRSLGSPQRSMATLMASLLGPASQIGYWQVNPGTRGGSASCTVAMLDQVQVSVCAWATRRTVGAVLSPLRDTGVRELATIMIKMRFALQSS